MQYKPHPYQDFGKDHIIKNEAAGLFMEMGLGKTACTLTAIDELMYDRLEIKKVLVIAPKKVAESTWTDEIEKWDHLGHLRVSVVLGTAKERKEALNRKADIYIINRENIPWLISMYQSAFPFDTVVIDELSSFKSPKAIRFKALKTVRPLVKRVIGLTGTPAPNGLIDLWPQIYLLDQGRRLGKTIGRYREQYFKPAYGAGHITYKYSIRKEEKDSLLGVDIYEKAILDKISDICISMKATDYLDLPKRIDRINWITLPPDIKKKYDDFEKDLVMPMIGDNVEITAVNAAVLTNKLLQFTGGAIYDDDRVWHEIHSEKIEALEEDIEAANGEPVLVYYAYQHELERMLKRLRAYKPKVLTNAAVKREWDKGNIRLLFAHPASAGHGLNMQTGGHFIEWFGLQWGLELYQQAVARLDRQGQTKPVINSRILVRDTIDIEVLASLGRKATKQEAVMAATKALIKKYKK